jgi:hypothetical protein
MVCLLASDDLACNELMQTSCSSFANVGCHVRAIHNMSLRINLVSPHQNIFVRAFDMILHAQNTRTEMPSFVNCRLRQSNPGSSGAQINHGSESVILPLVFTGRYLGNSGVKSGAPHRPPECLADQPSSTIK